MLRSKTNHASQSSQLKTRTGLRAGSYSSCNGYCGQEFNRCMADGTPSATCNDRLPVCQNACSVCAMY
jgi:hypothetical protein